VAVAPICRRFASDDAVAEARKSETESKPSSADIEEQSSIPSAISSATESTSTYASDAAESLTKNASVAKDAVVDAASGVTEAAALPFSSNTGRFREGRQIVRPPFAKEAAPTNSVYIGNLLFEVTEQELQREFAEFGEINEVRIARDHRGLSKGYVFLEASLHNSVIGSCKAGDSQRQNTWTRICG
jgi:nucleolin